MFPIKNKFYSEFLTKFNKKYTP